MTKLMEWLGAIVAFFAVWSSIVFGYADVCCLERWMYLIIPAPILIVGIFGIYAIAVILYRVITFNDCEYAAKELQEQIIEAKEDLKSRGFHFS